MKRCVTMAAHISREELREKVYYNAETGMFLWRNAAKGRKPWAAAGCRRTDGYLVLHVGGRFCYGHRLAWLYIHGEWPDGLIDHIDGNPANNAISNLRIASRRTNAENRKGASTSSKTGYLGVYRRGDTGKFTAQIRVGDKRHTLGSYATAEHAYEAYLTAKRALHEACTL